MGGQESVQTFKTFLLKVPHQFSVCEVDLFEVKKRLPEAAMLSIDIDVEHQKPKSSLRHSNNRHLGIKLKFTF